MSWSFRGFQIVIVTVCVYCICDVIFLWFMPFALCFILFWLPIPNFFLKVVLCYTLLSNHYFLLFRCLQLVYFFCYRISSWFLASHYFLLLRFLVSCYPMAILYLIYASFFGYLWSLFHIIHVMGIQLIAFVFFHQLKKKWDSFWGDFHDAPGHLCLSS